MSIKYTPILRWKAGEKNCLENLSPNVASQIIPFIEVSSPTISPTVSLTDEKITFEKKITKLLSSFNTSWENKPFFLYLSDNWYTDVDSPDQIYKIYEDVFKQISHPGTIPAFNITDEINISNSTNLANTNGICLRIKGNSFELLSQSLQYYINSSWIIPQNTDLLLDLTYIDENIYPQKAALTTVISDIPNISDFRRIIIASCSFPKDISSLRSDYVNEFIRHEATIHKISLDLQKKFDFNYVYSDYGPMNLNEVTFILGMVPNFKIKYSTEDKYIIVKGLSLKKGGLDLPNVVAACKQLVSHPQYSGETFSYGDNIIYAMANGKNTKSGNLTNWVGYCFNHHITLIVSLM